MKNQKLIVSAWMALIGIVLFMNSCKKDEDPAAFSLVSLTANGVDLNGATSATGIDANTTITATFSEDINAATATDANVKLVNSIDNSEVPIDISVSGKSLTITPTSQLITGNQYTVNLGSGLKSTGDVGLSSVDRSFTTEGIGLGSVPQSASQVLYLQFDNSIADLTANATNSFAQVTYAADRFGEATRAAHFAGSTAPGNGDIVELTGSSFISPSMTVSIWFNIATSDFIAPGNKAIFGIGAEQGFFAEMGDGTSGPNWLKFATDHAISPDPMSHGYGTNWATYNGADVVGGQILFASSTPTVDLVQNGWHQLVMTHDAGAYIKTFYIDGVKIEQWSTMDPNGEWNLQNIILNPTVSGIDPTLALGFYCSRANTATGWAIYSAATNTFKGDLDDMRIWNLALTSSEVTSLYDAEKVQ